jgi:sugar-specific transcriptional regulator TrmB
METKQLLLDKIASLEEANARLQSKIDEQKHLAEAVNSKDKEIGTLSEQISAKWQRQIEEKDRVVKMLVGHIQTYQQTFRSFLKSIQGSLENAVELEALIAEQLNKK